MAKVLWMIDWPFCRWGTCLFVRFPVLGEWFWKLQTEPPAPHAHDCDYYRCRVCGKGWTSPEHAAHVKAEMNAPPQPEPDAPTVALVGSERVRARRKHEQ